MTNNIDPAIISDYFEKFITDDTAGKRIIKQATPNEISLAKLAFAFGFIYGASWINGLMKKTRKNCSKT